MRKLQRLFQTLAFSLAILLACASPAHAECYTLTTAPATAPCIVMPYGAEKGVWFRLDEADSLRKLKLEMPELRQQLVLYQTSLELYRQQSDDYRNAYQLQLKATESIQQVNIRLVAEAREAKQSERAWYRSPILWFGVGFVLASAGSVAIAVAAQ